MAVRALPSAMTRHSSVSVLAEVAAETRVPCRGDRKEALTLAPWHSRQLAIDVPTAIERLSRLSQHQDGSAADQQEKNKEGLGRGRCALRGRHRLTHHSRRGIPFHLGASQPGSSCDESGLVTPTRRLSKSGAAAPLDLWQKVTVAVGVDRVVRCGAMNRERFRNSGNRRGGCEFPGRHRRTVRCPKRPTAAPEF